MPLKPLNQSDRNPPGQETKTEAVVISIRPAVRAVKEGWNTEIERAASTSASSTDAQTVAIVAADRKTVKDHGVQSTTNGLFWRARHVKEGSTAGLWTNWANGTPQEDASGNLSASLASVSEQDSWVRLRDRNSTNISDSTKIINDPSLNSFRLVSVEDDSTNLTFETNWSPGPQVADSSHTLEADFFKSTAAPSFIGTVTLTTSPASVTSSTDTISNTSHADGVTGQRHVAEARLTDGTNTLNIYTNPVNDIQAPA